MAQMTFLDFFSGIGGFREGLTRAGGFECVGHCEIDKYANRSYNALFDTKGEWFVEDARKADPDSVKIGDSSTATIFTISNSIYQFQYIDLSTKEKNLQFIIRGTTGATPYKMQKTN